jgi:hypothetical protein
MRLLEEVALVVEENKKLKEALECFYSFQGIPSSIKDQAMDQLKDKGEMG